MLPKESIWHVGTISGGGCPQSNCGAVGVISGGDHRTPALDFVKHENVASVRAVEKNDVWSSLADTSSSSEVNEALDGGLRDPRMHKLGARTVTSPLTVL